nr:hypothetical protein GCM10025699_10990 [Microbacterium flavescens]
MPGREVHRGRDQRAAAAPLGLAVDEGDHEADLGVSVSVRHAIGDGLCRCGAESDECQCRNDCGERFVAHAYPSPWVCALSMPPWHDIDKGRRCDRRSLRAPTGVRHPS